MVVFWVHTPAMKQIDLCTCVFKSALTWAGTLIHSCQEAFSEKLVDGMWWQGSSNLSSLPRPTSSITEHGYVPSAASTQPVADLRGLRRLVSLCLFWTAHFHHSLLGWSRCLLYGNFGGKSKTQTVGGNINRLLGSLVFTVPDLHISSWLFLYSLYCISPRDCCFVTFCTIVLAGFVLHTVLKKFHTILCLFFFFSFMFTPSRINST